MSCTFKDSASHTAITKHFKPVTLTMAAQSDDSRPLVVLLTMDKKHMYNEMYRDFTNLLKRHADVEQITTASEAKALFKRDAKPAAILAADESLAISNRAALLRDAASYVRSGGTLVFMGLFSSFTRPSDLERLFSQLDLPWSRGDYHRTTFALNPAMTQLDTTGLASSYSQKALHVANVQRGDAVYLTSSGSRIESAVFAARPVDDRTQAPAAFARLGAGKVGYVGDVNNETETATVVLRMCGLGP